MKRLIAALIAAVAMLAASAQTLQAVADKANAACPQVIVDGLTLQSVTLSPDGKSIAFQYGVDDSASSFAGLKSRAGMLKEVKIDEFLTATDPEMVTLRDLCVKGGVNIVYTYSSGDDSFSFTLVPADIE